MAASSKKRSAGGVVRLGVYPALNGFSIDVVNADGRTETLVAEGEHAALMILKDLLHRFSRSDAQDPFDPATMAGQLLDALGRFARTDLSGHKARLQKALRTWAGEFSREAAEDVIDLLEGKAATRALARVTRFGSSA